MMEAPQNYLAVIKVIGIGGGGVNAVNRMIEAGLRGVEFIAINTDAQTLLMSDAEVKLDIGRETTRGLGAGSDPDVGRRAVDEHMDEVEEILKGADMVFVTAGMGGGTGTGGAPVVANVAKSVGALVVGIVTKPFTCEGRKRMGQAEAGIEEMKKHVDTLIMIPNQKLLSIVERNTPLQEAFDKANDVLYNATRGISELITIPGLINVDFADVRTIMREMGDALMGSGVASGENRAIESAHAAISSPLLEGVSISGAQGVLVNVTGGPTMSLVEVDEAVSVIHEAAGEEANVILGAVIDENLGEEMIVTVIATGFNKKGLPGVRVAKPTAKVIDRIPVGLHDLQKLDEPAFMRKGIDISVNPYKSDEQDQPKIDNNAVDTEKPAFLRKIMD